MTYDIGHLLERVTLVSQGWTNDPAVSTPLRHMSRHLSRLSANLARSRFRHPAAVRDVEALFCQVCQRIKSEADADCRRTLGQCRLLKDTAPPLPSLRL